MVRASNRCWWEDGDVRYLRNRYRYDTLDDIGAVLGCSGPTVKRKVEELGLKRPKGFDHRKRFKQHFIKNYVSLKG